MDDLFGPPEALTDSERIQKVGCWACGIAAVNPATGCYCDGCQACRIRAVAQSPEYHDSLTKGSMTPAYRSALKWLFGDEGMAEGHQQVKAWAQRIGNA